MFWVGFRAVDFNGENPGSKCLLGPFETYDLAKIKKERNRAIDMEQTETFEANSREEAQASLDSRRFSRL